MHLPRRIARFGLGGLFALAGVFSSTDVLAQWPHQVDIHLLITDTSITASAPAVAADGAGGVFAAWNDNRNQATGNQDIFAQYYDANGIAKWPANGVPVCTAANRQDDAHVVDAGNGFVYVVWSDERGAASNPRVFAQLLNADGEPQWTADGIRIGPNEFGQTAVSAISDGAGNLIVAWGEAGNNSRTFVQKLDQSGAVLWGASGFEFSSGVFEGAAVFNVVPDGAGGAVLGWVRFGENPRTVYMRRILSNGTPAFDAVPFGTDVNGLGNIMAMAPDGTGGAYLGWQVDNGTNDNLYLQRVDGTGNLPWGSTSRIIADVANVQDNLQLARDNSGGAFIVWDDPRTGVDNVYIQHVTPIGSFSFEENGRPVGTSTDQRFEARLIPDGAGGAIISFRQNQDGTFVQRIDNAGTRLWGDDGVQITGNSMVNFPRVTHDGTNGVVLGALAFAGGQNRAALKRVLGSGELPTSRLANISTRAFVGTGDAQAIPGFVIGGTGTKNLLIRAVGPQLLKFGLTSALEDPILTLFDSTNAVVTTRDDWDTGADAAQISETTATVGAFGLDAGGKDAAIVSTLQPGGYTAGVTGSGNGTGISLVEIYDAGTDSDTAQIVNLSSRVFVGTGEAQAIPGFVIEGPATMTLLIRAIGPTLGGFGVNGVLADPILTLYNGTNAVVAANDNWSSGGSTQANAIIAAAAQVGAFALTSGSLDSTLLVTLPPGAYTAGVVGADDGTGVCLIELYIVP